MLWLGVAFLQQAVAAFTAQKAWIPPDMSGAGASAPIARP